MFADAVPFRRRPGAWLGSVLLGLPAFGGGWAGEVPASTEIEAPSPRRNLSQSLAATRADRVPLNLLLTRSELLAIVRNYEARTGEMLTSPITDDEEVLVIAPGELAPMRDPARDVAGGLAAPFWAIAHPSQAWRIFAPIPAPAREAEAKPVRAEDRPYWSPTPVP